MYYTTARVNVKNDKGEVVAFKDYQKVNFDGDGIHEDGELKGKVIVGDPEAMLGATIEYFQAQVGEDGNGVLDMLKDLTYAHDLDRRSVIRRAIEKGLEGPDKAIEKAIKQAMAAREALGKPITYEEAKRRVMED